MALDENDPMVELAAFGKQVELFFNSKIGDYILKRIESEVESATELLKRADPTNEKGIRDLQFRIRCAENTRNWLADAIVEGKQALSELESRDA